MRKLMGLFGRGKCNKCGGTNSNVGGTCLVNNCGGTIE